MAQYEDDYELAKAQLNQRLSDIRVKFNQHMTAIDGFIRGDMKYPHDDESDVIHASNEAQQRIANIGYEAMELIRDMHKASVKYHKAKARYKRKGQTMTDQTLQDMLRYSVSVYRDKWVVVSPPTDDMAAGGFVSPHFRGEYGAYDWYLDPENHATHIVRNGVIMVWRKGDSA